MIESIYEVTECPECGSKQLSYLVVRDQVVCRSCGLVFEPLVPGVEKRYEKTTGVALKKPEKNAAPSKKSVPKHPAKKSATKKRESKKKAAKKPVTKKITGKQKAAPKKRLVKKKSSPKKKVATKTIRKKPMKKSASKKKSRR